MGIIKLNQDKSLSIVSFLPPPPIQYYCRVKLDNVHSQIEGTLPQSFWDALSLAMSYEIPGAFFSQKYQKGFWDGRKKLFNKRYFSFPTGLFSIFREVCKNHGVEFQIIDVRQKPNLGSELSIYGVVLRDYQIEAIQTAIQKQRGTVKAPTGCGKSLIAAGLIAKLNIDVVVFIHTQDIFHQLVKTFRDILHKPIGEIGCGKTLPQNITVCMIQTAYRSFGGITSKGVTKKELDEDNTIISKPEIIQQCLQRAQCIIVDEAHRICAGMYSFVLSKCNKAYYRINFTATPWRETKDDILLDAYAGPICVNLTASELIKRGVLSKPTIYLYEFDHGRPSVRGYQTAYDQQVVKNIFRNKLVVQLALKAAASNKTCLIAVTRVEHGQVLELMLKEVLGDKIKFAHGSVDSEERKQILKDLDDRKLSVVVATVVFSLGIDLPSLDVLINCKAADSGVDSFQLVGRALRRTPTKTTATIIDIFDKHCKYLGSHANSRLKIYRTESEYSIQSVKDLSQVIFV